MAGKEAEERTQLWGGPEPLTGSLEASAIATSTWCLGVFQPLFFKLGASSCYLVLNLKKSARQSLVFS